ncbi:Aspartate--tRNA(Asp/Asn) ligase [uncultured archaeon]|nr:Aspartate--tRNA(Asp/Asn) ligase [uncultured archaeon]
MERALISSLKEKINTKVLLKGFVHEIRDQSKVKFIILRDISGLVQLVIQKENKEIFDKITKISRESVLQITGLVKEFKNAPGGVEVDVESYKVLSEAASPLPISVAEKIGEQQPDLSIRLDWRWLDLRKPKNALIFKIWTEMEAAMREYWLKNGFMEINTPKFVAGATESGAELFSLDYFGKKASLAQSPQFYKQMAMAAGFEKIFEVGPVFRANKSHTIRHDTEFTSVDIEVSYINSHQDIMKIEEDWMTHILTRVKEKYGKEIKETFGVEIVVPKTPFPRITMADALALLKKEYKHTCVGDLDPQGEKLLFEHFKKTTGHEFVFVHDWPLDVRPFYHMRENGLSKSFDLLWKGMEITTGAQREHRYEILKKQAEEKNVPIEGIKTYLEFFKYGCPPHGGYGLSPSRVMMLMLELSNVREATFLPRDTDRLNP